MTFYGVWAGKKTGIFTSWKECEEQIKGFSFPKFKKLQATTLEAAEEEFSSMMQEYQKTKIENKNIKTKTNIFYDVWAGHQIGVYETWTDCEKQIDGYKHSIYKKIYANNKQDADIQFFAELKAIQEGNPIYTAKKEKEDIVLDKTTYPIGDILTVDGASDNQTSCEYQGVFSQSKKVAFKSEVFDSGTNNIAEFIGLVHAIKYVLKFKVNPAIIYTDSMTALSWLKNKKANTTARETGKIKPNLEQELINAEKFLIEHDDLVKQIKVLKWETKLCGEIPSDFGRK